MNFDEVLDQERLRECLATGTGKGVKIGVLDSGIESDLPELNGCVKESYEVIQRGRTSAHISKLEKGEDVIDHGTACAYIIHQLAPDAELYSCLLYTSPSPRDRG